MTALSRLFSTVAVSLALGALASPALMNGEAAEAFENFRSADPADALLPDFSYSGYHYCEQPLPESNGPERRVAEFGAVPDDGRSDRDALQAAFDEAERSGGFVLRFESGVYLLDAESGETPPLVLHGGNTVLLGSGSGPGGTTLRMSRPMSPRAPEIMHSTPFILNVSPRRNEEETFARVVGSARRGEFQLEVESESDLRAGDWVTLFLEDPAAVDSAFGERAVSELWTRLKKHGVMVAERHQIAAFRDGVARFREPLQVDVDPAFAWELRRYSPLEEIGIEGIRFEGGWNEPFVHHRSARDDGAWSCLKMTNVANSWIRDVVFDSWNYALRMDNCSANSVLRIQFVGAPAHYGIHTRRGYGNLFGLIADSMGNHHGPSVGYSSASTVYWRYQGSPDSSFDAHSTGPYATLLDACSGAWMYGRSGGPLIGMPNHMRGLTLWNFERTGGVESEFNFWRQDPNARDRFLDPIIVGFHGQPTAFAEESLGYLESLGAPVEPESLFEAQLALRLGAAPAFLRDEMELWERRDTQTE